MYKIIGVDLKEYGPVSTDQLRQWIAEGRVNAQTKVRTADATEWKAMAEIAEFADVLPKPPPPPLMPAVPITPLPAQARNSKTAVWSMVLGILSVLCCQILGPVAVVLGAVALSQLKKSPELTGRGFAITGIVLGILALLIVVAVLVMIIVSPDLLQNLQSQMQR
jgi:hypothetical protein